MRRDCVFFSDVSFAATESLLRRYCCLLECLSDGLLLGDADGRWTMSL